MWKHRKPLWLYNAQISNSITTKEDRLFKSSFVDDWRNGIKHNIPINATFQLFNFINITPSFNYTERWYFKKINQDWNEVTGKVVNDTVHGFHRVYNYNVSLSANTTLYGFYKPASFIKKFENAIINIHPSLIPSFCGMGYYGLRVHAAAIEYGVKLSGATVHFVEADVDGGAIIMQRSVPVEADDTPESLKKRVLAVEHEMLPECVKLLCEGKVQKEGRTVRLLA